MSARINDELDPTYEALKAERDALADRVERLNGMLTESRVATKSAEERADALAVENARCKFEVSRCHQTIGDMFKNRDKWIDKEWLSSVWSTSKRLMDETPATDAALAEIKAQGLDELANACDGYAENHVYTFTKRHAKAFAAELREAK